MHEVRMPRLSDSMAEGTIVEWLVRSGDVVKRGDALVEIETDKATMPYEADAEGVVHIVAEVGGTGGTRRSDRLHRRTLDVAGGRCWCRGPWGARR
jgi:multidrug efflux pump subunit AcrA (membrane-fusion protein)